MSIVIDWWSSLNHGGLLISPDKVASDFAADPAPLPVWRADRLRRAVTAFDGSNETLSALLDFVLNDLAELPDGEWQKAQAVDSRWSLRSFTGVLVKPRRLWKGPNGEVLPVFVPDDGASRQFSGRLGVGRSRQLLSRVVEWLRQKQQPLALVTNGRQWRMVHAGQDYDAWCEWDIDLWFVEGAPGPQVTAWRQLVSRNALVAAEGQRQGQLLAAILASRKGQADLSAVLGERVRQAVEELITASHSAIEQAQQAGTAPAYADMYVAGSRIVMRCIITLFAEARNLLPVDNPVYQRAYSLEGLRQNLDRRATGCGNDRLSQSRSAWPRLMALFRLIHEGSSHEALPVPHYSGALFAPGDAASKDGIDRALALLEGPQNAVTDKHVQRMLRLLTRTKVRVRQGRSNKLVDAPVDFSALSSEYIGILYEGLLDFELKQAGADEPVIFLAVGNEPALTLSQLEGMGDVVIKQLFDALKKKDKGGGDGDEDGGGEDDAAAEAEDDTEPEAQADAAEAEEDPEPVAVDTDELALSQDHMQRAQAWLEKAAVIAGLVKKPRGRRAAGVALGEDAEALAKAARSLCARQVAPGQFYLVRWGGTRKGAGTFYTRPQLAAPTVRRTLQPLAYEAVRTEVDLRTGLTEVVEWQPKRPEDILALKVCDPAMGSGSFLAGALRYLTDALVASLYHHKLIERADDGGVPRMADGQISEVLSDELLKLRPTEEGFEDALCAQLKRHVVERCLYGVDLDPLAVELGRMALWVETMDRNLPFGFLDHKLKVGNALVGAWFDTYRDYPALAWDREGGDKDYQKDKPQNLVNHFYTDATGKKRGDKFTTAIAARAKAVPEQLVSQLSGQMALGGGLEAGEVHDELLKVFKKLHRLPVHDSDRRAAVYRDEVLANPHYHALKARMDLWCALWFWPGEQIGLAPLPLQFNQPDEAALAVATELAAKRRFFHWELEFPDVFTASQQGFDAMLGNPPWEIQKPNSKEFFSNHDPLYRAYGKQQALGKQLDYFRTSGELESHWIAYNAGFKALSNWAKCVGSPFGDREYTDNSGKKRHDLNLGGRGKNAFEASAALHEKWSQRRKKHRGFASADHPFAYQGSADLNTYKLFFEQFINLANNKARIGIILPSSVHNDIGSFCLRSLWIQWLDLIAKFDNEKRIFSGLEHNSKFDVIVLDKSGLGNTPVGAFFSWVDADVLTQINRHTLPLEYDFVKRVSPFSLSLPEIRSPKDRVILEKIYETAECFGNSSWPISEFHMTSDSAKFASHGEIPLYQGGMIWINDHRYNFFDVGQNKFHRGKLESVEIRLRYPIKPRYFVKTDDYIRKFRKKLSLYGNLYNDFRLAFRVQTSRSNQRTFISTILPPGVATGNSLASINFQSKMDLIDTQSIFASLVNDFNVRTKVNSNVNSFYIPQLAKLPVINPALRRCVTENSLRLICTSIIFKDLFENIASSLSIADSSWSASSFYATEFARRRAQAINDAIFMHSINLTPDEVGHLLGSFPGIDRSLDADVKYHTFVMSCFLSLQELGPDEFLKQNDRLGWLPAGLKYSPNGLVSQSSLGERMLNEFGALVFDWQIDAKVDSEWKSAELAIPSFVCLDDLPGDTDEELVEPQLDLFS